MSRFSLRSLLLVLALVVQTAAGGTGFAGTVLALAGVSANCEQDKAGGHQAPPVQNSSQHKHDCLSCQLCVADGAAAANLVAHSYQLAFRDSVPLDFGLERRAYPTAPGQRAHQPRAPPTLS
jgi:hypothetical protein